MPSFARNDITQFQGLVWGYYRDHARPMPWRTPGVSGIYDPYEILVSEIMLQQTQVARVIPKYEAFLAKFPTAMALANAEPHEVLRLWSGLGYNRRALYLHNAAQHLVNAQQPWAIGDLMACKGIGSNTAGAVLTYAYDVAVPFVETNIRTVLIHHFFHDQSKVTDKQLLEAVRRTLPDAGFREWFYALMDYGAYVKQTKGNAGRQAKSYKKQSQFHGSKRQVRGSVLRLLNEKPQSLSMLKTHITDERLSEVLGDLHKERLIHRKGPKYFLG